MSIAKNDVTGDSLISKPTNAAYSDGWDRIFGEKTLCDKYLDILPLQDAIMDADLSSIPQNKATK